MTDAFAGGGRVYVTISENCTVYVTVTDQDGKTTTPTVSSSTAKPTGGGTSKPTGGSSGGSSTVKQPEPPEPEEEKEPNPFTPQGSGEVVDTDAASAMRDVPVCLWVSPEELEAIQGRMAEAGIRNMSAYLRKMALNGYVLSVDLSPVRELVSLQRRCSNNLNQVGDPGQHLRGHIPGGDQGPATRLCGIVGPSLRPAEKAVPGGGTLEDQGASLALDKIVD